MKNLKIILVLLSLLFFTCKRDTTPPEDICKYSKKWSDELQIAIEGDDTVKNATSLYNGDNLLISTHTERQSNSNAIIQYFFTINLDYSGIRDTTLSSITKIELEHLSGKKDTMIVNSIPIIDLCTTCNNTIINYRDTLIESKCKTSYIEYR